MTSIGSITSWNESVQTDLLSPESEIVATIEKICSIPHTTLNAAFLNDPKLSSLDRNKIKESTQEFKSLVAQRTMDVYREVFTQQYPEQSAQIKIACQIFAVRTDEAFEAAIHVMNTTRSSVVRDALPFIAIQQLLLEDKYEKALEFATRTHDERFVNALLSLEEANSDTSSEESTEEDPSIRCRELAQEGDYRAAIALTNTLIGWSKQGTLEQIVEIMVMRGDVDDAIQIVQGMDDYSKDCFLGQFLNLFVEKGDFTQAIQMIHELCTEEQREFRLCEIAIAACKLGNWEKALEIGEQFLLKEDLKNDLFQAISNDFADRGKFVQALEFARKIVPDPYGTKVMTLHHLYSRIEAIRWKTSKEVQLLAEIDQEFKNLRSRS